MIFITQAERYNIIHYFIGDETSEMSLDELMKGLLPITRARHRSSLVAAD